MFITPGDAVSFKTIAKGEDSYEVIFEGKNAAHYNYASQKRKFISQGEPDFFSNPDIDLLEYKQQLQDHRDKENEFLRNYKKKHTVSEDFINHASAEISNKYAFKLYQAAFFNKCRAFPEGYLDDAVIIQNPLSFYTFEALQFKYIYCSPDENIERIYNAILNEVNPVFHSRLLSSLITYFAKRGDRIYKKSLLQVMEQIEKTSTDSTLLATVQEYKPYYLLSGTKLPDNILDKTYLRSFKGNKKITLRQMFDNYKNRAIYLDFWFFNCFPCRVANKESAVNKPYFAEKQIAVVYISVDIDENGWRQASKDDGVTENQYLLLDDNSPMHSPLCNYLKVISYPRYVLFNKNHEIEILNAPRPFGCEFEDLKKMIERVQSVNLPDILEEKVVQKTQTKAKTESGQKTEIQTNRKKTQQKGVLINGVIWATSNVDAPGTFAKNPEDTGMFYQWNRKIGWSTSDPMTNSDGGTTWNRSRNIGTYGKNPTTPAPPDGAFLLMQKFKHYLTTTT
jgi:hypothetical protein